MNLTFFYLRANKHTGNTQIHMQLHAWLIRYGSSIWRAENLSSCRPSDQLFTNNK